MLSDVDVDNLIMPLLSRQEELNRKILVKMADRINQIGGLSATDLHSLEQLYRQGEDVKQINKWLADYTGMQQKDIKKIIKASAQDVYEDAKPFYKNKQITQIPFAENKTLQMYIQAIANNTNNTFMNLSNAAAFMLRDPSDPTKLVATPIARAYQEVIDKAVQASSEGFVDYNTAMRDSMRELINSGIYIPVGPEKKVQYQAESERIHYQRLDTAVRRNVLDGIRATNQMTQQLVGEEFGADGYEITVHSSPAPDHAEIQGHQFTKEQYERMQNGQDFQDVKGKLYMAIKRKIGQWNCKHFAYAIVIGVATPVYTDDELQEIIDKNNVGYTAPNGKHFTTYECTQKMRQMETEIRKLRDGKVVAEHSGDSVLADEYRIRINKRRNEYKAFAKAAGLKPRLDNTRITNPLPKKSIKAQGNPSIPPVFGGQSFNIKTEPAPMSLLTDKVEYTGKYLFLHDNLPFEEWSPIADKLSNEEFEIYLKLKHGTITLEDLENVEKTVDKYTGKYLHEHGFEMDYDDFLDIYTKLPESELAIYNKLENEEDELFDSILENTTIDEIDSALNEIDKELDIIPPDEYDTKEWLDRFEEAIEFGYNVDPFEYFKESNKEWLSSLDEGGVEQAAVRQYTGSSYTAINDHLRGLYKTTDEYYLECIDNVRDALDKVPELQDDIIVKRGCKYSVYEQFLGDNKTWLGKIFTDKGFMSTSADSTPAFSGVSLEILLPKGSSPGTWVAPISKFRSEMEFLLKDNSHIKILSVEYDSYGQVSKIKGVWIGNE